MHIGIRIFLASLSIGLLWLYLLIVCLLHENLLGWRVGYGFIALSFLTLGMSVYLVIRYLLERQMDLPCVIPSKLVELPRPCLMF